MRPARLNRPDPEFPKSPTSKLKLVLTLAGILGVLFAGVWMERAGLIPKSNFGQLDADSKKQLALLSENLNRHELQLNAGHLAELVERFDEASAQGHALFGEAQLTSARFRRKDEWIPAGMRLRSNGESASLNSKMPLAVETVERLPEEYLKELYLDSPALHGFASGLYLASLLQHEGFLTRRPELVALSINGADHGFYLATRALPQVLAELGLAENKPLVRFVSSEGYYAGAPTYGFHTAPIVVDSAVGTAVDVEVQRRTEVLLEGFRRGELTTSEAFDRVKLARLYALSDLLGTTPSASWSQLSFLYDPVLGRLAPTGFSVGPAGIRPFRGLAATLGQSSELSLPRLSDDDRTWFTRLFEDEEFYLTYVAELSRIIDAEHFDVLLEREESAISEDLALLQTEFPEAVSPRKTVKANRKVIQAVLDPKQTVRAHLIYMDQLQASLSVSNLLELPIEIIELDLGKNSSAPPFDGPIRLEARRRDQALEFTTVSFDAPDVDWTDKQKKKLEIRTRVLGASKSNKDMVIPKSPVSFSTASVRSSAPNFREFSFLQVDDEAKTVTFDAGLCALGRDLVLPSGWTLVAGDGTTIDLLVSSAIITHSPLRFDGSAEDPVRVQSSDGTGQGVCVIDAAEESIVFNTEFTGLHSIDRQGWQVNGAITFYRSSVWLEGCRFSDMRSEDALNAVETQVLLQDCVFEGVASDAFDADYCEGQVNNCSIIDAKDDAIDLSGSSIDIQTLRVNGAGDKGISAGEDTIVDARALWFVDCKIAVASKNRSACTLAGVSIRDCSVGLSVYQNNDDSGPASIVASDLDIRETKTEFEIEADSRITVDGREILNPE